MKKLLTILLALCSVLCLAACGDKEKIPVATQPVDTVPTMTIPQEDLFPSQQTLADLSGRWASKESTVTLEINTDGQLWYKVEGEVMFRGYLEQIALGPGSGYVYRYDLYSDSELLIESYHLVSPTELIAVDASGEITDRYTYQGAF